MQGLYGIASNRRSQAMQEMLQARNQPINEIAALMGGGQVHLPGAQAYQGGNIAAADVAGNVYNTAALQQKQYEQQMAQHNQHLAGMYGLGQAAIGGGARALGRESMIDYRPRMYVSRNPYFEALLKEGTNTSPIGAHTQGMSRLAFALLAGLERGQMDRNEREARERLAAAAAMGGQPDQPDAPQIPLPRPRPFE